MSQSKLDKVRRDKVKQFVAFTAASESVALSYLNRNDFQLEVAVDSFYANPPPPAVEKVDRARVMELFRRYADAASADCIGFSGIEKLQRDANVSDDDISLFVLAWRMQAKTVGEFTRDEFVDGLVALSVDDLPKLKAKLASLRAEVANERTFRDFYAFLFEYGAGRLTNPAIKCIEADAAVALWRVALRDKCKFLELWVQFLEAEKLKAISRDAWMSFLDFSSSGPEASFDECGAWPTVFDEFVAYARSCSWQPKR